MARTIRLQYPGALYHVMCRGDRREAIFADDQDREVFLRTLGEMAGRTGALIHSYVLMGNHYHLLLETPEPNLVAGMKWFQGTYTQRFNVRHRHGGHLFQGRYKAIPIEPEEPGYLAAVSDYIHLNPARARLLAAGENGEADLLSYRWSSHPRFVQEDVLPEWLRRERVFGCLDLPDTAARARQRYGGWMQARTRDVLEQEPTSEEAEEWRQLRRGWYVGGESFRDRLQEWAKGVMTGKKRSSFAGAGLRGHDEEEAERTLRIGLQQLGMELEQAQTLRQTDPRKQTLAWLLKSRTVVSNEWIQQRLRMGHRANVSRAMQAVHSAQTSKLRAAKELLRLCAH